MRAEATPLRVASLAGVLLTLSGCASLMRSHQEVVAIARPVGASVFIDGEARGAIPLLVNLSRARSHDVEIVMPGGARWDVHIHRVYQWVPSLASCGISPIPFGCAGCLAGFATWAVSPSREQVGRQNALWGIGVGVGVLSFVSDMLTGAAFSLEPTYIGFDAPPPKPEAPVPWIQRTLAVLEFHAVNVRPTDAALVADMVRHEFVLGGTFKVVDKKDAEKLLAEKKFQQTGCTTDECRVAMGKALNVEIVATGDYGMRQGERFLALRLLDTATGYPVFATMIRGKSVADLEAQAGAVKTSIRTEFRRPPIPAGSAP